MGIILGLLAAIFWGIADLLARAITRRIGSYRTLFSIQIAGFLAVGLYLFISGEFQRLIAANSWQPWAWVLLAGVMGTIATLMLYRAFEIGTISIVSPIASSYAALTALLSILSGERLSQARDSGIILALIGVVLAATSFSSETGDEERQKQVALRSRRALAPGVLWAILSSIIYGVTFWLIGFRVTPFLGGIVPAWCFRLAPLCVLPLAARPLRQSIRLPSGAVWWLICLVSLIDTAALVCASVGLTTDQVSVVSVLSSLFSAVTVVLAWIFLREKLAWSQWLGVLLIFIAIVLVNI